MESGNRSKKSSFTAMSNVGMTSCKRSGGGENILALLQSGTKLFEKHNTLKFKHIFVILLNKKLINKKVNQMQESCGLFMKYSI